MTFLQRLALFFPLLGLSTGVRADIRLPAIFSSRAVFQQNQDIQLWGWAAPEDRIVVICSWLPGREFAARADRETLRWSVALPGAAASFDPHSITIKGGWQEITLSDLLFGEVWLCSGQSNMEWRPSWGNVDITEAQYKAANDPHLRFFTVPRMATPNPAHDCQSEWLGSSPNTLAEFSATAYFFGRELRDRLSIPIGLINTAWGGTPIEAWMHETHFQPGGRFASAINERHPIWRYARPGAMWHGMIAPLTSLKIKGFLWYQGETNTYNAHQYDSLLVQLATDWRQDLGNPDLPFYYVQIAPYRYDVPREGAALRDAQRRALPILSNAGMVVTSDIGDIEDIHPRNKTDVGRRLATWALNRTYEMPTSAVSGPLYRSFQVEKNHVRVFFDFAENGFAPPKGGFNCFEVAGSDRRFYPANAEADGSSLLVSAPEVPQPVAVRFAFQNTAEPNLFNAEGLPASCFRTDDWPVLWPNPIFKIKQILENGDALVDISTPDPLCRVRYTLDGSLPSELQGEWAQPGTLIALSRGKVLKTKVFDRNDAPADRCDSLSLRQHLASGKPAKSETAPDPHYPGSAGDRSLTDGLLGGPDTHEAAWSGYAGDSPAWTIDLGEKRRVRQISVGFLVNTRSWVFPPEEVRIEVSDDGKHFFKSAVLSEPQPKQHLAPSVLRLTAELSQDVRFIRISAKNIGVLPDWHPGKGNKAWLFVDEVEVE